MMTQMEIFTQTIFTVAQSPWALVVLAALLIIDGVFPLVPGETSVVALATLGATGHGPAPWAVLVVAVVATMVGDAGAFFIGRKIGTRIGRSRLRFLHRPHVMAVTSWAAGLIERRPAVVLVAAKFIPLARVAITIAAGASPLKLGRYLAISFVAATVYTGYHVVVAMTAGALFAQYPLLALASSLGFGVAVALIVAAVRKIVEARTRAALRRQPPVHAQETPRTVTAL